MPPTQKLTPSKASLLDQLIRFCLEQKLVVFILIALIVSGGIITAPFDWDIKHIPRSPVPVDAIPDIGENQQIVFTQWVGRSPQDVDDQISYPLTVALLGIPHVKDVRSYSMFGFSSIYVIFDEEVEFYWSRTRIIEKLNSLPDGTLPAGVSPSLGPDATALGQVYWYTLEGRDPDGNPTGGWDLEELRRIQDWQVRYALQSADGVAEVASIGGHVKEYQIDVDPDAMRAFNVTLEQVFNAVKASNVDVGARTIEVNEVEYVVRGLGFIKTLADIEAIAVAVTDDVPVLLRDIAHITMGPALRRGVLDKAGAEAVGGVVVVRYGDNPLRVIKNVKAKIAEISAGLEQKILPDGTVSQVTIVPFYDRTGLIYETLGTLNSALIQQILVTIIVVLLMVMHLRSTLLISAMLPLAVLVTFIAMKQFGVDANVVALSGIAIAVGTIVDMGIVLCENMLKRLDEASDDDNSLEVIYRATTEVGSAVLTAVATTVVSFLPVFALEGPAGKLFKPLAYTKSFALIASVIIALTILPPMAHLLLAKRFRRHWLRQLFGAIILGLGTAVAIKWHLYGGILIASFGTYGILFPYLPNRIRQIMQWTANFIAALFVVNVLVQNWEPLGPASGFASNAIFVGTLFGTILLIAYAFLLAYPFLLAWALRNKLAVLIPPIFIIVLGFTVWRGFDQVFNWLPQSWQSNKTITKINEALPGLGNEFMPSLDEGSFLYMPTTMVHASIGEALDTVQKIDMAIAGIPEIEEVVGKIGRVDSPMDPAPISMVETIVNYKPEYLSDANGKRLKFRYDTTLGEFARQRPNRGTFPA